MNRFPFLLSVSLLLMGGISTSAVAQTASTSAATSNPASVLARVDSVLNAPDDMEARETMVLIDQDGTRKARELRLYQKGADLRLVQFLAPADVRGVSFLRRGDNQLYLYLPAFRKVRRIASSATREDFVGTDFTYEDLAQSTYSDEYRTTGLRVDSGQYVLDVRPRPEADVSYDRLTLRVDTSNSVLRQVQYFREGTQVKEMTVSDVTQIDGYWIGRRMEMVDQRSGHRTVLALSEVTFDQELSDALFTERYLKRPVR